MIKVGDKDAIRDYDTYINDIVERNVALVLEHG